MTDLKATRRGKTIIVAVRVAGVALACLAISAVAIPPISSVHAADHSRGLLWRVVQGCVLAQKVTGTPFPCLSVETTNGLEAGYAVLRLPTEDTHLIVTPTVRTIGVEADRLRSANAPDYFHDAWLSRHFVTDALAEKPPRGDIGMAVNSRPGRSQDQLHIHVACVRAAVRTALEDQAESIQRQPWSRIKLFPTAPLYRAHFEKSHDLAGINIVDLVAKGLDVDADDMDEVTIAVVGAEPDGFFVLARTRIPNDDKDGPHAEALLDHDCKGFAKS